MPSRYTEPIYNGQNITFEQFANSCLRNFGIYLRWEGRQNVGDFEIPDKIEPSDFHKKRYDELNAEYIEFIRHPKSKEQLEKEYLEYVKEVNAQNEEFAKMKNDLRARYESMLEKVRKWVVPSASYQGVKDFMESQLLESIEVDCNIYVTKIIPKDKWIANQQNRPDFVKNMNDHLEQYHQAVASAAESTQWLKTFTESIRKVK
jgi:hypothetical protein